jgi:hypothetical protein
MTRTLRLLTIGGVAVLAAACVDKMTSAFNADQLNAAFSTSPLGFDNAVSSFNGTDDDSSHAFMPDEGRGHGRGPNGLELGHDFMGGGFGRDFLGGPLSGGRPFDRGGILRHGTCTYAAGTNTCVDTVRNGVVVNATIAYTTAAGAAQQSPDSTTDKVVSHVTTAGTFKHRSNITTVVSSSSDRTVSGLAYNSTQRKVDGKSKGSETTTGSDSAGTFSIARVIGDTTSGVVIPIASGKPTYPTAGTVIRQMTATITRGSAAPTTTSRREVITYDGSATAKLVVTQDGTTKNCTIALPRGRPVCS